MSVSEMIPQRNIVHEQNDRGYDFYHGDTINDYGGGMLYGTNSPSRGCIWVVGGY